MCAGKPIWIKGVLDTHSEKHGSINMEKINHYIQHVKEILRKTDNLTGLARQTLSRVEVRKWEWHTHVGTGDAMWTAMATGMIWSVKTTAIGVISQLLRLQAEPQASVRPEYRAAHLSTRFTCIAQIRFGYAILAGMQLFVRIIRTEGGVKLWQNILFKA